MPGRILYANDSHINTQYPYNNAKYRQYYSSSFETYQRMVNNKQYESLWTGSMSIVRN